MPPKRPNTYASQGSSQRRRLTQVALSDSSEEDDDYNGEVNGQANGAHRNGESSTQPSSGGLKDNEINIRAGQLARFALFQEYKKTLIRRPDIIKNVLPNNARAYNAVFLRAQTILRNTVGCELVEVRPRGKGAAQNGEVQATQNGGKDKGKGRARQNGNNEEDENDDEAAPTQSKKSSSSTNAYILRSILPPRLLAAMSNPSPLPLEPEAEDAAGEDFGALLAWDKGDGTSSGHIALLGIRTVILAIVMTMGRVIADDVLHAYLRRLNLKRDTILPYSSPDSKEPYLTLDKYLDLLAKQNYLEKVRIPGHGHGEGGDTFEWKWGQREVEFSEKDAATFIEQITLGEEDEESSSEEEDQDRDRDRRRRRNGQEKVDRKAKRNKLKADIAKAAGGELTGKDW
ncbi:uncharacterized protein I303_106461 [Kwoniella dejecticola CBS 10117]|uniref:MAGE domain-containing protein n=1 Tax=Kwoniella dejecticola CBS 10117 TaxID=1296121 RepID=A0AAJ8MHR0_9TREE